MKGIQKPIIICYMSRLSNILCKSITIFQTGLCSYELELLFFHACSSVCTSATGFVAGGFDRHAAYYWFLARTAIKACTPLNLERKRWKPSCEHIAFSVMCPFLGSSQELFFFFASFAAGGSLLHACHYTWLLFESLAYTRASCYHKLHEIFGRQRDDCGD